MNKHTIKWLNRAVKWINRAVHWGKQSSKMNVRQYNEVNKAVQWMSDNTMR